MHPADSQEFERLQRQLAETRKLLIDKNEECARLKEKIEQYRMEAKRLAEINGE